MNRNRFACAVLLAAAFAVSGVFAPVAKAQAAANAHFVVTVQQKRSNPVPRLRQQDLTVRVKGHPADIVSFQPAQGGNARLQLVFLFDESAPGYLSLQIPAIKKFIDALPPTAEVAVAYMANGRAVMAQKLTGNHQLAGKALRLTNGIPGINASPYFCLSDLAKHWPAPYQVGVRRVVFMVTNGEDPYYTTGDLQDPYVAAAIQDSQKAGLLVFSIYFRDRGQRFNGRLGVLFGQSYLQQVAQGTGGYAYNEALMSPVSFTPFLDQFKTALENQYWVGIAAQGKGLVRLQVKSHVSGMKLDAPSAVEIRAGE